MAHKPFAHFDRYLRDKKSITHILDMRSARGNFALRAIDYFEIPSIDCIESDYYMTESYRNNPKINLICSKYYEHKPPKPYDLVYSCHTLEHYRDPKKYLNYVASVIRKGGYFFLDVPNVKAIAAGNNYDDYFYDKHLFYFAGGVLRDYLSSLGFDVLSCDDDGFTVELLLQLNRTRSTSWIPSKSLEQEALKLIDTIKSYKQDIESNRAKVLSLVTKIEIWLIEKNVPVIFGMGRLLDCLVEYGKLDLSKFAHYVDNYLSQATPNVRGFPVDKEHILLSDHSVDAVLVLTRFSSVELINHVKTLCPHADVRHFSEFL